MLLYFWVTARQRCSVVAPGRLAKFCMRGFFRGDLAANQVTRKAFTCTSARRHCNACNGVTGPTRPVLFAAREKSCFSLSVEPTFPYLSLLRHYPAKVVGRRAAYAALLSSACSLFSCLWVFPALFLRFS